MRDAGGELTERRQFLCLNKAVLGVAQILQRRSLCVPKTLSALMG
jgi:hypothetical protein